MTIIDRFLDVVVGIGAIAISGFVLLSMWSILGPCRGKSVTDPSEHTLASGGRGQEDTKGAENPQIRSSRAVADFTTQELLDELGKRVGGR
ncbi:hypothetical protein FA13DRAFT_1787917 [Coprinellus micaceus]|uniref:Uncharacterized protein n=1 Tax=Coprinellus micaceus TaxID=71717 RepID=A0A4Y7TM67_COPMI|nr:hypothetical protein FA13DRAFT_1787917 [Coprinellus micaceus]